MNDVEKYILMRKEIEMGNSIPEEEKPFFNKMNGYYETDLEFKNMIDMTLVATNRKDVNAIINGTKNVDESQTILIPVSEIMNANEEVTPPSGGDAKGNQKVKSRNGYADALILALVSGFIFGTAATVLFILM